MTTSYGPFSIWKWETIFKKGADCTPEYQEGTAEQLFDLIVNNETMRRITTKARELYDGDESAGTPYVIEKMRQPWIRASGVWLNRAEMLEDRFSDLYVVDIDNDPPEISTEAMANLPGFLLSWRSTGPNRRKMLVWARPADDLPIDEDRYEVIGNVVNALYSGLLHVPYCQPKGSGGGNIDRTSSQHDRTQFISHDAQAIMVEDPEPLIVDTAISAEHLELLNASTWLRGLGDFGQYFAFTCAFINALAADPDAPYREIWDLACRQHEGFDDEGNEFTWESVAKRSLSYSGTPRTLASIFHEAMILGWRKPHGLPRPADRAPEERPGGANRLNAARYARREALRGMGVDEWLYEPTRDSGHREERLRCLLARYLDSPPLMRVEQSVYVLNKDTGAWRPITGPGIAPEITATAVGAVLDHVEGLAKAELRSKLEELRVSSIELHLDDQAKAFYRSHAQTLEFVRGLHTHVTKLGWVRYDDPWLSKDEVPHLVAENGVYDVRKRAWMTLEDHRDDAGRLPMIREPALPLRAIDLDYEWRHPPPLIKPIHDTMRRFLEQHLGEPMLLQICRAYLFRRKEIPVTLRAPQAGWGKSALIEALDYSLGSLERLSCAELKNDMAWGGLLKPMTLASITVLSGIQGTDDEALPWKVFEDLPDLKYTFPTKHVNKQTYRREGSLLIIAAAWPVVDTDNQGLKDRITWVEDREGRDESLDKEAAALIYGHNRHAMAYMRHYLLDLMTRVPTKPLEWQAPMPDPGARDRFFESNPNPIAVKLREALIYVPGHPVPLLQSHVSKIAMFGAKGSATPPRGSYLEGLISRVFPEAQQIRGQNIKRWRGLCVRSEFFDSLDSNKKAQIDGAPVWCGDPPSEPEPEPEPEPIQESIDDPVMDFFNKALAATGNEETVYRTVEVEETKPYVEDDDDDEDETE